MSSFPDIKLNDGRKIPQIGFGTWKRGNGDDTVDLIDTSIHLGFNHIDTAQSYRNETEAGEAIRLSGLKREDIWITTKYSGGGDAKLGVRESAEESLKNLGVDYVDLYLIHAPRVTNGDIPGTWRELELLKKDGLAKSIGVSNFGIPELQALLLESTITPAVNQIFFHPEVWEERQKLLTFQETYNIVTEAFSPLYPITSNPGGPTAKTVKKIAKNKGIADEQVLLAWVKAKNAVILTSSTKKERLERYLAVADIDLTEEEVATIDKAGAKRDWRGAGWVLWTLMFLYFLHRSGGGIPSLNDTPDAVFCS